MPHFSDLWTQHLSEIYARQNNGTKFLAMKIKIKINGKCASNVKYMLLCRKYDTILFSDSFLYHLLVYDCCELQYRYEIGHLRISFFSLYLLHQSITLNMAQWHKHTYTTHTNTWFWIVTTNPLNIVRSE